MKEICSNAELSKMAHGLETMCDCNECITSFVEYYNRPGGTFEEVKDWCSTAGKLLWNSANDFESRQLRVYIDLKMSIPDNFTLKQYDDCHKFLAEVHMKLPFQRDPEPR